MGSCSGNELDDNDNKANVSILPVALSIIILSLIRLWGYKAVHALKMKPLVAASVEIDDSRVRINCQHLRVSALLELF